MLTNHHLLDLAQQEGPWVTIGMAVEGGGPLAKQDPIRYRNLLRKVDDLFDSRATEDARREAMMQPLREIADRHDVFNAGARGLVVFASPRRVEHWHLPVPIEEVARVDERPYLEPLIPLVTDPVHFYVITLSLRQARVLECSRFVARELPLPKGTPTRMEDAAGWEVRQDSLQLRQDVRQTMFHGHGAGKDDRDADIEKYVRELDRGLWEAITHKDSPVVMITSERIEPLFRDHTRLPNVVEPFLHGSVEHTSDAEIHARALELVAPRFEKAVEQAKERLLDLLGTGNATSQIGELVIAAADGRIDTLFVREGAMVPGTYDADAHTVSVGDGRPDTTDLLDRASTDVFLSGGRVYRLSSERMPVTAEAAAILRY